MGDRDIDINSNREETVMHNIGVCREFQQQPCYFLVTDEDVVGPFDERSEVELFSYCPGNGNGSGHRDHEDMIDGYAGF